MTFNEYQKQAITTLTIDEGAGLNLIAYMTLGLAGETGEIAEKIKKIIRNHEGDFSKLDKEDMTKELGDVLWYLSALSTQLGIDLGEVAKVNLAKINDRKQRGVINSTGDNR